MPRLRQIASCLTTRARCLVAGGFAALLCGLLLGSGDLVRAGGLVLAVPAAAYLVVCRSQVTIASRRTVEPGRTAVGGDIEVHLTITNRSALPVGALMLEDRLPVQLIGRVRFSLEGLSGRESRTIAYKLPTPRRGRFTCGPLRVRLTDPFGLIELTRSFSAVSSFVVTPTVDMLPAVRTPTSVDVGDNAGSHSIGSHGADDASTREYRDGDDSRKIHWRSTARTGSLMVRHEERPWQGQVSVLLDTRACAHAQAAVLPAGDVRQASSLEWAISAAASIGSQLLTSGREVSLLSTAASTRRVPCTAAAAFVDHLAELSLSNQADLTSIVPQLRAAARDSTVIALLGYPDEASVHAVAGARPRGSAAPTFAILLDAPSWARPAGRPHESTPGSRPESSAIESAADTLQVAGWWVAIARSGDAVPALWSRLLRQREFATGASSVWSAPVTAAEQVTL